MKKNKYLPLSLIVIAIISGCSSVPAKNAALEEAHNNFNIAHANPVVNTQAALEMRDASDSLYKADEAMRKGQGTTTVNHLSYIASQKVGIAQEVAKRKTSEAAVVDASKNRDKVLLSARTNEADASKRKIADMQETANYQAEELAAADANAASDQELIAQQERQLKELNAVKTKRGLVITLGDVLFSTNKSELKSGSERNMQKLAEFLKEYPKHTVLIEGHTDSTGGNSLNQALSERRALAVKTSLVGMGVGSDRVNSRGYGEMYPVASNKTEAGRQMNRRVEIILSDDKGNIAPR
ncbi:MAG TPA: OmpA family protein [Gallionella sp.]|nr:OmpA family protein [Gallionella sp.]